jgi:SWI/SNF-related matrix-associated actin-dependent regulator 1 of chromatin subfamily A
MAKAAEAVVKKERESAELQSKVAMMESKYWELEDSRQCAALAAHNANSAWYAADNGDQINIDAHADDTDAVAANVEAITRLSNANTINENTIARLQAAQDELAASRDEIEAAAAGVDLTTANVAETADNVAKAKALADTAKNNYHEAIDIEGSTNAEKAMAATRVREFENELEAIRKSAPGLSTPEPMVKHSAVVAQIAAANAATAAAQAAAAESAAAAAVAEAEAAAVAEAEAAALCCVCKDAAKGAVFKPCGHACVCFECGKQIAGQKKAKCPICRARVKRVEKVFL